MAMCHEYGAGVPMRQPTPTMPTVVHDLQVSLHPSYAAEQPDEKLGSAHPTTIVLRLPLETTGERRFMSCVSRSVVRHAERVEALVHVHHGACHAACERAGDERCKVGHFILRQALLQRRVLLIMLDVVLDHTGGV